MTAVDHVVRAVTYEWKCRICGDSAYVPFEGGTLKWEHCKCEHTDQTRPANVDCFHILNGKRTFWTRVEDIGKAAMNDPPT